MNLAAGVVGIAFGALLFLSGMADYDVIHTGLLFEHSHLYLMMVATIGTAAPLLALLRRRRPRSVFGGGPVDVVRDPFQPKHVRGGLIFGAGWGIAGTCPGAVAAMVAAGKPWGLVVMAGIAIGVVARDAAESRAPVPATTSAAPAA